MDFTPVILVFYILIGIGAIIFVHELGHFLTAKLSGVRVEAFSLGFYPTFLGMRRTLNGLLVGLMPGIFKTPAPEVGGIEEGSPADRAGVRIGDLILEIDGKKTGSESYEGMDRRVAEGTGEVKLKLLRREKTVDVSLAPESGPRSLQSLGLYPHLSEQAEFLKGNRPEWVFGLEADERVVKAAGRTFENREEFQEFALEAARKGAGVVRLDIVKGEEEARPRHIALAVRPERQVPKLSFLLPILAGREGETEYRLSLLPIGGYVKMAGDIPGETTGSHDEFLGKSVGARGMIFAAGSVMNAVFGCLCFILAYQVGVQSISPEVGGVYSGLPAGNAGLKTGDRVLSINGMPIKEFFDIPQEIAYANPADGLRFEVERNGETILLPPADRPPVKTYYDPGVKRQVAGILPVYTNRIESMVKKSPLYEAGIRPKDRIKELAGRATENKVKVDEVFEEFLATGAKTFSLVVERDEERLDPIRVEVPENTKKMWLLGIIVGYKFEVVKAPGEGLGAGNLHAGDIIRIDSDALFRKGVRETILDWKEAGEFPSTIPFQVERDGGKFEDVPVEVSSAEDVEALASALEVATSITVKEIGDRSHLAEAGIPVGAVIERIGGKPFSSQKEVFDRLGATGGSPIEITWRPGEGGELQRSSVKLVPKWNIGIKDLGVKMFREKREYLRLGFTASIVIGVQKSFKFAKDVFRTLRGIFTGRLGGESIGGPITIARASYYFAEYGFGKLLFFMGLLSINLAIINLFPIPILDGGHLVFLLIEKVKGSPVSETGQALAQYAGLLILVSLMVYVTWNDIGRLLH